MFRNSLHMTNKNAKISLTPQVLSLEVDSINESSRLCTGKQYGSAVKHSGF